MATSAQKVSHIVELRRAVGETLASFNKLRALRREWDALGLSSDIAPADFVGPNVGLETANLTAVYVTMEAIEALMAQGHATNLYSVRP